jgi:fatty acid desaturase
VQFVNCRHCGTALKVQRNESVTFTEVMNTLREQSARIEENTELLRIQGEIALLDREWEERTAQLIVQDKHGRLSIPGKTSSVVMGVVLALFFTFWTAVASFIFPPFAIVGVVLIVVSFFLSISSYWKAEQYERLKAEHETRRQVLMNRLRCQ